MKKTAARRAISFLTILTAITATLLPLSARGDGVVINEFMASNQNYLEDEDGSHPDWIELYNSGAEAYELEGHFLTDDSDNLDKWRFPAVSLAAGEPDFDTPDHIKQAASAALDRGETKYAKPASGVAELKSAVIDKLGRENNLTYAPDQIIATIGGKEGLYLAFATLLDLGDEVIVPTPY